MENLPIIQFQKLRIMWHLRFSFSSTGYCSPFMLSPQWFSLKNMVLHSFLWKTSIIVIRENSVRIHWNLWTLHIGQTEFPAGIWNELFAGILSAGNLMKSRCPVYYQQLNFLHLHYVWNWVNSLSPQPQFIFRKKTLIENLIVFNLMLTLIEFSVAMYFLLTPFMRKIIILWNVRRYMF